MIFTSAPTVNIRPEHEILLCCARTHLTSEQAARLCTSLREDLDWDYLLKAAGWHGLISILYWHLNANCPDAVPAEILHRLREHFYHNAQHNLFLTGELIKILKLFESNGIPAVPYRGPSIALSAYGNLALRSFVDIDILVHKEDALRVKDLLLSLGYRPEHQLTGQQEAFVLQYCNVYPFFRDDNGGIHPPMVEIHWNLVENYNIFPFDYEGLWKRLESTPLFGITISAFSQEDVLWVLCMHGAKHAWRELKWICDIAELIRAHNGLNWKWLLQQARTFGGERQLFLGLWLAYDLLDAPLPNDVLYLVRDNYSVRALADQMNKRLFITKRLQLVDMILFHLRVTDRVYDRIRYCLRIATLPHIKDFNLLPLPTSLFFLYEVLKPIFIVRETLLNLLRHNR